MKIMDFQVVNFRVQSTAVKTAILHISTFDTYSLVPRLLSGFQRGEEPGYEARYLLMRCFFKHSGTQLRQFLLIVFRPSDHPILITYSKWSKTWRGKAWECG